MPSVTNSNNTNSSNSARLTSADTPPSPDLVVPGLGSLVTLLSSKQIRYEGALYSANLDQNKITLANVRCFGTEDRSCARPVRPSDAVYEYVVFSAGSIVRMEITQGCPVLLPRSAPMRRDPAVCLVTTFGRRWGSEEAGSESARRSAEPPPPPAPASAPAPEGKGARRLRFFPRRHSSGGARTFASALSAVPEEGGSSPQLLLAGLTEYPEVETARTSHSPPSEPLAPGDEEVRGSPSETADRKRRRRRRPKRRHTIGGLAAEPERLCWSREANPNSSLVSLLAGLLSPVPAFSPRPQLTPDPGESSRCLQDIHRMIHEISDALTSVTIARQGGRSSEDDGNLASCEASPARHKEPLVSPRDV